MDKQRARVCSGSEIMRTLKWRSGMDEYHCITWQHIKAVDCKHIIIHVCQKLKQPWGKSSSGVESQRAVVMLSVCERELIQCSITHSVSYWQKRQKCKHREKRREKTWWRGSWQTRIILLQYKQTVFSWYCAFIALMPRFEWGVCVSAHECAHFSA